MPLEARRIGGVPVLLVIGLGVCLVWQQGSASVSLYRSWSLGLANGSSEISAWTSLLVAAARRRFSKGGRLPWSDTRSIEEAGCVWFAHLTVRWLKHGKCPSFAPMHV